MVRVVSGSNESQRAYANRGTCRSFSARWKSSFVEIQEFFGSISALGSRHALDGFVHVLGILIVAFRSSQQTKTRKHSWEFIIFVSFKILQHTQWAMLNQHVASSTISNGHFFFRFLDLVVGNYWRVVNYIVRIEPCSFLNTDNGELVTWTKNKFVAYFIDWENDFPSIFHVIFVYSPRYCSGKIVNSEYEFKFLKPWNLLVFFWFRGRESPLFLARIFDRLINTYAHTCWEENNQQKSSPLNSEHVEERKKTNT